MQRRGQQFRPGRNRRSREEKKSTQTARKEEEQILKSVTSEVELFTIKDTTFF